MIKIGLLPGLEGAYFKQSLALMQNDCGTFQDYWIHLKFEPESPCVFTQGMDSMTLPIRHGEGRVYTMEKPLMEKIEENRCVPCRYIDPETQQPSMKHPHNPNGSINAVAGICDPTGRLFGMMPHPEAYLFPENHPHWDTQKLKGKLPPAGYGLLFFRNAVNYLVR
jgi:phosphoribosylformylglycinamidine synthase